MALRLISPTFSTLLGWSMQHTRSDTAKDAKVLVLRHQLAVLQRRTPPARMSGTNRALIAALTDSSLSADASAAPHTSPHPALHIARQLITRR
jgi:hypothetical protein